MRRANYQASIYQSIKIGKVKSQIKSENDFIINEVSNGDDSFMDVNNEILRIIYKHKLER